MGDEAAAPGRSTGTTGGQVVDEALRGLLDRALDVRISPTVLQTLILGEVPSASQPVADAEPAPARE
jgi:hypothetical protein